MQLFFADSNNFVFIGVRVEEQFGRLVLKIINDPLEKFFIRVVTNMLLDLCMPKNKRHQLILRSHLYTPVIMLV